MQILPSVKKAVKSLLEMFPLMSGDCLAKNSVQVNVERKEGKIEANHQRKIQDSEPQHHQTPALDRANEGKKVGVAATRVCFTGYRVRPLDPDNFAGSVKDLLDGLRHASIIAGDEPWRITLETRQEKVKSYAEEKTVIEIDFEG